MNFSHAILPKFMDFVGIGKRLFNVCKIRH